MTTATDFQRGRTRGSLSGHEVLRTLKSYVLLYEQLYTADPQWGQLERYVRRSLQEFSKEAGEWRTWVEACEPVVDSLRSMTLALADPIGTGPDELTTLWKSYIEGSNKAINGAERIDTWKNGQKKAAQVQLNTLLERCTSARGDSIKLRHQLIEQIRTLVYKLENLLPGES